MSWEAEHERRLLIEDVQWLLDSGEHPSHIAARLGRTLAAIEQACRRHDRPDLARHFDDTRKAHA